MVQSINNLSSKTSVAALNRRDLWWLLKHWGWVQVHAALSPWFTSTRMKGVVRPHWAVLCFAGPSVGNNANREHCAPRTLVLQSRYNLCNYTTTAWQIPCKYIAIACSYSLLVNYALLLTSSKINYHSTCSTYSLEALQASVIMEFILLNGRLCCFSIGMGKGSNVPLTPEGP